MSLYVCVHKPLYLVSVLSAAAVGGLAAAADRVPEQPAKKHACGIFFRAFFNPGSRQRWPSAGKRRQSKTRRQNTKGFACVNASKGHGCAAGSAGRGQQPAGATRRRATGAMALARHAPILAGAQSSKSRRRNPPRRSVPIHTKSRSSAKASALWFRRAAIAT